MSAITRSVFLQSAAAAVAGRFVPTAKATTIPGREKPEIVKMAELLAVDLGYTNDTEFLAAEVGLMAELQLVYKERPFPVPEWLAKKRLWAAFMEEDRKRAEGTLCHPGEGHWNNTCAGCGDHIGSGNPLHYHGEGKETMIYHPECCPACIKAGRASAEAALERKRRVQLRKGHYCASHDSGPHGRCHECGRFMSKTEPRHVDARTGYIYHPNCCRPCQCRPADEPNELVA